MRNKKCEREEFNNSN